MVAAVYDGPKTKITKIRGLENKVNRSTSCERCKKRKQKCDHRLPSCTNCLKANAPCIQPEKYRLQVPQKDPYTSLLEEKVLELQEKLKKLDPQYKDDNKDLSSILSTHQNDRYSPQINVKVENDDLHSELGSTDDSLRPASTADESFLGEDRNTGDNAPQSFSVVSSLLNDTFAFTEEEGDYDKDQEETEHPNNQNNNTGTTNNTNATSNTTATSGTVQLIPGYNFEGFLRYRPAFHLEPAVADELFEQCLQNKGGRSAYLDRAKLREIHENRAKKPADPNDPEFNFSMFVLYMSYAMVKTMDGPEPCGGARSARNVLPHTTSMDTSSMQQELGGAETDKADHNTETKCNGAKIDKDQSLQAQAQTRPEPPKCNGKGRRNPPANYLNLYSAALRFAQNVPATQENKIWQILALVMCSFLQMRSRYEHDNGTHCDMVKKSMKLCVEINLHKEEEMAKYSLYDQEMRKRLFWAAYNVERIYCLSTGRKFSLDDREITISFPANINDEDLYHPDQILAARARDATMSVPGTSPVTSMSFLIGIWRLRRLESSIVHDIYFSEKSIEERFLLVSPYYDSLQAWLQSVAGLANDKQKNIVNLAYASAVRILLQPFLSRLSPESDFFRICVNETGRLCSVFSTSYRARPEMFSTIAVNTNFVAGLTLIYCLWLAKDSELMLNRILEHLRVCSSALYTVAERSATAIPYREKFEKLVSATVNHIFDLKDSRRNSTREVLRESSSSSSSTTTAAPSIGSTVFSLPIHSADTHATTSLPRTPPPMSFTPPANHNGPLRPPGFMDPAAIPFQNGSTGVTATSTSTSNTASNVASNVARPNAEVINSDNTVPTQETTVNPQVQGPQLMPTGPLNFDLNPWVATESYGYDDSIFNMIQDISVWTRQANGTQEPLDLFSEHAMDLSFS